MQPKIYITKLKFNDGTEISLSPSDIIIFTGANNVGKSQVLRDIHAKAILSSNPKIVIKDADFSFEGDIVEIGEHISDDQSGYKYRVGSYVYSTDEDIKTSWDSKDSNFWRLFVNLLNTEGRLTASNNCGSYDVVHKKPSNPVQAIYADDGLEKNVSDLFHEAFNTHLIVNRGGGNTIILHVGEEPTKSAGEDRVSKKYLENLAKLPELEKQGDGMRSFAGVLLSVFSTYKTINLIDEPEAFLHPPQARLLGRMLVKNRTSGGQLFISTHSEDFLKGVLDTDSEHVKIIRINRNSDINEMNVLENQDLKSVWKDSILRYSNILSGLFHSKVVICESDTDCRFYQAVMNAMFDETDKTSPDILFTHCGGKDRFKAVIPALTALKVKTVVVPDIDVLNDETTFKTICEKMGVQWNAVNTKWKTVSEYVNNQRAQLDKDEARKEIDAIFDGITTTQMSQDDIDAVKRKLKASSAWSKVKEVGKAFFSGCAYTDLDDLMKKCKLKGLFIVPAGELESFYKPLASKANHGTKWVNAVLQKDLPADPELAEARRFVKEIVDY